MNLLSRRKFLAASAASAGSAVALSLSRPHIVRAAETQPSTYNTVLIGSGWWGKNILREAVASGACKITAVCDVDPAMTEEAAKLVKDMSGGEPKRYEDFRECLEKEKPHVAIVATPDHWHPLITIAAVRGGAHVYVEKPVGHTIGEGRAMVKAARDARRIVQVGMHRRISPHNVSGRAFLQSGKAGKIGMARCFVNYGGGPEKPEPNAEPPAGLNWDLWCGPGPLRPFNDKIHPKGFRGFLDYANGTLGDWGIHWMDQVLWVTGEKFPKRVFSTGGRPIKGPAVNDGNAMTSDAPDHQIASWAFENFDLSWEHRQFAGNNAEKTHPQQAVGAYFYGTEGTFHMGWLDGWTFYPADAKRAPIHQAPTLGEPDQQNIKELWADFLRSIQTGQLPVSDIEAGHLSTNMSLLAMMSMNLARSINWDGERELCIGDDEANKLLRREYRKPWTYPTA